MTREGIRDGKYKPCLDYHIHNCGAPCINKQSYEEYQENMRQAREILKGNTREVSKYLYDMMMKMPRFLSSRWPKNTRESIFCSTNLRQKRGRKPHHYRCRCIYYRERRQQQKRIHQLYPRQNGTINQSFTYEYKRKLEESDEEL